MTTFINAFPDLHHTIEKMVVEGPDVWALYTEHITEADFVSDDLRMMRQLGAVAT